MTDIEIKKLLDQIGFKLMSKMIRDQQVLVDSFKAEVARCFDSAFKALTQDQERTQKEEN